MKRAEEKAGRRLLDVLDVHWYPEARGGAGAGVRVSEKDASPEVAAARVQAPRSLWDPTYVETSWITRASTKGKPVALIPRLRKDVENFYPGTKIAITEYNYGAADHVSGGIAQADVLGIFGRESVFAANWWRLDDGGQAYVDAAFDLYLNYDGKGARFGNRSVFASTDDVESTSIHAGTDEGDPSRVTLVLINRSNEQVQAVVKIAHSERLETADAYRFTAERAAIEHLGTMKMPEPDTLRYTLPPMSASTVRVSK
jgi:mannan endo-1,4-beta-mannosidase